MLFTFTCLDVADSQALRQSTRPAHLAWLEGFGERVVLAGPLLGDDGATPVGSLLVVACADRAAAEAFAAADPYRQAGLFRSVEIRAFRQVLPR